MGLRVRAEKNQDSLQNIFNLIKKTNRIRSASHPIVETLAGLSITSVIAYGGWQVMHHTRTTGEFISFIAALILAYEPMKRLSNLNANLQEGLAAGARVFKTLDQHSLIKDPENPLPFDNIKGEINFKNVSFSYEPKLRL